MREKANALVQREMRNINLHTPHPTLPTLDDPKFSDLIEKELERINAGQPIKDGIDMSRYEAPDEPSPEADAEVWRGSLRSAYTSSAYMSGRHTNLALLEELGKNAWLVGNSQLEEILKNLDQELAVLKEEVDSINRERKTAQEGSKGEILALQETWKQGIGRLVEVQMATDQLRRGMWERKRAGHS